MPVGNGTALEPLCDSLRLRSDLWLCQPPRRRRARGIAATVALFCLDPGSAYDLAPFLGAIGNELTELCGRARIGLEAQFGELDLESRIRERGVHMLI